VVLGSAIGLGLVRERDEEGKKEVTTGSRGGNPLRRCSRKTNRKTSGLRLRSHDCLKFPRLNAASPSTDRKVAGIVRGRINLPVEEFVPPGRRLLITGAEVAPLVTGLLLLSPLWVATQ
jgi:hypothetical protein